MKLDANNVNQNQIENYGPEVFMNTKNLISVLNDDLADEHAAILRYLVHAYQEGEDTLLGGNLLSRAREEMWHMHWLGMIIANLGGEPEMMPAHYPFDPTNRKTILQSYIDYELKLIPHYNKESDLIENPHIKRILQREAWESSIHARKFQRLMEKMTSPIAEGKPGGGRELSPDLLNRLQEEVSGKYLEMLQHMRTSWVCQEESKLAWQIMDQSMEKMKQLAHFAEMVAENGIDPLFGPYQIERTKDLRTALEKGLVDLRSAQQRHADLQKDPEVENHAGMVINLDLTLNQERFSAAEIADWLKES
jgi:bacterioferritin